MKIEINKKVLKIVLINIFFFIMYFILIQIIKLNNGDDYVIGKLYQEGASLSQKLEFIQDRAKWWNIRVGEMLYCFLAMFNPIYFKIVASILFVTFLNLITYFTLDFSKEKDEINYMILMNFLFSFIFLIMPCFYESYTWIASIYNHITSAVIDLIVLIPYRKKLLGIENKNKNIFRKILYYILCILTGMGSELMLPVIVLYILYVTFKKKGKILDILPIVFIVMGFLFAFFISSYDRMIATQNQSTSLYVRLDSFKNDFLFVSIITLICIIIMIKFNKDKELFKSNIVILIFSFFSVVYILFFAPYYTGRGILIYQIGILIVIGQTIIFIIDKFKNKKTILMLFIIISILSMIKIYNLYLEFFKEDDWTINYIYSQMNEQPEGGVINVEIKQLLYVNNNPVESYKINRLYSAYVRNFSWWLNLKYEGQNYKFEFLNN